MAALIDALPAVDATVAVPDVRNPRTSAVELPVRIVHSLHREAGGLEAVDWSTLAIGGCVELMVFTSGFFAHQRRRGLRLEDWNGKPFDNPDAVQL